MLNQVFFLPFEPLVEGVGSIDDDEFPPSSWLSVTTGDVWETFDDVPRTSWVINTADGSVVGSTKQSYVQHTLMTTNKFCRRHSPTSRVDDDIHKSLIIPKYSSRRLTRCPKFTYQFMTNTIELFRKSPSTKPARILTRMSTKAARAFGARFHFEYRSTSVVVSFYIRSTRDKLRLSSIRPIIFLPLSNRQPTRCCLKPLLVANSFPHATQRRVMTQDSTWRR
jgi:hypothetical protein